MEIKNLKYATKEKVNNLSFWWLLLNFPCATTKFFICALAYFFGLLCGLGFVG
jgi:hypothetical protein